MSAFFIYIRNILNRDTGEGIAREDLPYIFKRFYKAKNGDNSSVGIGLSLSKQIIAKQNETIEVESEFGKGTGFTIKCIFDIWLEMVKMLIMTPGGANGCCYGKFAAYRIMKKG